MIKFKTERPHLFVDICLEYLEQAINNPEGLVETNLYQLYILKSIYPFE